jgi:hypothetical protein
MSVMSRSTGVMVNVKKCATFQETRAAIKKGWRVTQIVTRSRVIGREELSAIGDEVIDDLREEEFGKTVAVKVSFVIRC